MASARRRCAETTCRHAPRAHKKGTVKVGGVACGPCWEQTIRNDALGTTP